MSAEYKACVCFGFRESKPLALKTILLQVRDDMFGLTEIVGFHNTFVLPQTAGWR